MTNNSLKSLLVGCLATAQSQEMSKKWFVRYVKTIVRVSNSKPRACVSLVRTQEEGGLAHGLEAAAAVLVHRPVPRRQDDQHPIVGELLASCHRSFQEPAAPRCDHLTVKQQRTL